MASVQPSSAWLRTWWTELPEIDKTILTGAVVLTAPLLFLLLFAVLTLK